MLSAHLSQTKKLTKQKVGTVAQYSKFFGYNWPSRKIYFWGTFLVDFFFLC